MVHKMRWIVSVFLSLTSLHLQAAVSLDRTRVIYPGEAKSISLTIHNNNNSLPYLAQAWLEDEKGQIKTLYMKPQMGYTILKGQKHRLKALEDSFIFEVSSPEKGTTYRLEDDYQRRSEKLD